FELFFINKDSFKDIPDKTNSLVESNDIEGIKEQLKNKEIGFDKLIELIDNKFETALKRGEIKTTIVNLTSLVFRLSIDEELKQQSNKFLFNSSKFLGGFKSFIESTTIKEILPFIDTKVLLGFIKEYKSLSDNILQDLFALINYSDDSQQVLIDFIEVFNAEPQKLKKVSSKFSEYFSKDKSFANKIKLLLNEKVIIENLIENKLIDDFIEKIENDIENEDSNQKLELISLYNEIVGLSKKQINDVTTKLITFVNSVNDYITLPFWLTKLNQFVNSVEDTTVRTNIYNSITSKQNWLWQQYNSLWNRKDYKETLKIFLEVITEFYCAISDTNQKNQLISWLNQYFSKNESQELIVFINKLFYNLVDRLDTYNWSFVQNILNRFTQVPDWETKKEIANTLNLMLRKTNNDKGLTEQQTQIIYTNYINLINEDNQEEIIDWISESLNNEMLVEHFEIIISNQREERKFELLKLLIELNKSELIENVISTILKNIECAEIEDVFEKIENENVSKDIIIRSIKAVLRNMERESKNFECLIEILSKSSFSDKVIHNLIAEKIKNLLATGENDEIHFALRIIDNLDINDAKKLQAIKTLIQDINESNFQDDDLEFVKKMKNKYE
ncbi:MAG: hypothetical protein V3V16_14790, partial [Melioribacteraceae bacterium]